MQAIILEILGEPKAQKRHRHTTRGKFTRTYDPSSEDKMDFLHIVQSNAPDKPFNEPLKLTAEFYFSRPKSHYRTGKRANELKETAPDWHTSKPDADNLIKFIMDSLNKIYWRDDSLICYPVITKKYSYNPRTVITIETL